jgi:prepilin-type N-terminal cleavage/methylation domain-containing protein
MTRPAHRIEAGFTLMESLIAVVILAGIAAVLVPAIRTAVRIEARSSALVGGLESQAATEDLLREFLLRAYRPAVAAGNRAMVGERSSMRFLSLASGTQTVQPVSLLLEAGALELRLPAASGEPAAIASLMLAEDVTQARFRYFGETDDGQGLAWQSRWETDSPPRLVALELLSRDGSLRRIEALVGGRGAFDCRFDSGQGICLADTGSGRTQSDGEDINDAPDAAWPDDPRLGAGNRARNAPACGPQSGTASGCASLSDGGGRQPGGDRPALPVDPGRNLSGREGDGAGDSGRPD